MTSFNGTRRWVVSEACACAWLRLNLQVRDDLHPDRVYYRWELCAHLSRTSLTVRERTQKCSLTFTHIFQLLPVTFTLWLELTKLRSFNQEWSENTVTITRGGRSLRKKGVVSNSYLQLLSSDYDKAEKINTNQNYHPVYQHHDCHYVTPVRNEWPAAK